MFLNFKKLAGRWFIDILYEGSIKDLEMVMNSDLLINSLPSFDSDKKVIEIVKYKTSYELRKLDEDEYGATYEADCDTYHGEIWLCPITKMILGKYPDVINFKNVII